MSVDDNRKMTTGDKPETQTEADGYGSPDMILRNPPRLTTEEGEDQKANTELGQQIMKQTDSHTMLVQEKIDETPVKNPLNKSQFHTAAELERQSES